MDIEASDLIVGLLTAALGLLGLFLAAGAHDNEMYVFGLSLAGWALVFVFGLMRRHFDRADAALAVLRATAAAAAGTGSLALRGSVARAGGHHE